MATVLIRQRDNSTFAFVQVLVESYTPAQEVTALPVDGGAVIADHIQEQQMAIVLQGMVTETPTGEKAKETAGPGRLREALAWLQESRLELLDVVSDRLGTITDCVLVSWPHEIPSSRNMPVTLQLRQIQLAERETVDIPASQTTDSGAASASNQGPQGGEELSTDEQAKADTFALRALQFIGLAE